MNRMGVHNVSNRSYTSRIIVGVLLVLMVVLSACSPTATPSSTAAPTATAAAETSEIADASEVADASGSAAIAVYAPPTPSSVPILLAAESMKNAEVTIFTDHAQAHTLFLRGDVDILVTGLSVGVEFVRQEVPVQIVNSYVSGLTYLVARGPTVTSVADLEGREVMLPFEGSPIEEVTRYFVETAGLTWGVDVVPVYTPFPAAVEMLRTGEAEIAALPEPFVSQVAGSPEVEVALSYEEAWNARTGSTTGYPQVGVFVRREWASAHAEEIAQFNDALADAIATVREDPEAALATAESAMGFPPEILRSALARTSFTSRTGSLLEENVRSYYETIGEPLDGAYDRFFADH